MTDASARGRTSRNKGRAFQSAVRDHLRSNGIRVIEEGGSGLAGGDLLIAGSPLIALECKSGQTRLGTDWKQAEAQVLGTKDLPLLAHKRHGVAAPGEQWVTCTLDVLIRLLGTNR